LSPNGQAFRDAVLVQYPRHGSWTIAFLTGAPSGEVAEKLAGDYVSVYVPTTPNPTSGFFLMMPRSDVQYLEMSVDAALKYIVSMGVVAPPAKLLEEPDGSYGPGDGGHPLASDESSPGAVSGPEAAGQARQP